MQIANCNVILNEFKSSVPKRNITPAEAMLMIHMHKSNAGETPVVGLEIQPGVAENLNGLKDKKTEKVIARTANEELARLKGIYKPKSDDSKIVTVTSVFPSAANVPMKFSEIIDENGAQVYGEEGQVLIDGKPAVESDTVTFGGATYDKDELAASLKELAELKKLKAEADAAKKPAVPPVK